MWRSSHERFTRASGGFFLYGYIIFYDFVVGGVMSLDERLKEIFDDFVKNVVDDVPYNWMDEISDSIAQIKAAFEAEGYVKPLTTFEQDGTVVKYRVSYETDGVTSHSKTEEVMTGQEWYERFEREFQPKNTDCAEFYMNDNPEHDGCPIEVHHYRSGRFDVMMEADEAARKAAGIE